MKLPAILIGAGGHARVVRALAEASGLHITGVCDPALAAGGDWFGLPVLGGDEAMLTLAPASVVVLNGLGKLPGGAVRGRVQAAWATRGFAFPPLVHPAAWVAPGVELGPGAQVMAGAIVQPGCRVGRGSIVNTRASIDHDGILNEYVHLAPGSTLCGDVQVGPGTFIGAGAVVLQGLRIGENAVVAAGAVLTHDLGPGLVLHRGHVSGAVP